jgi:YbbR domain-containing protein
VFERIRNNAGLKVLSLALAIGAWWYLRAANPAIAAHFDQQLSVPIVTTGLPPNEIARFPDKQAVVTIVMPKDSAVQVRPDDLRAVLNLGGRAPGVYAVAVTVIGPRLEIKSVVPSSETLQIERVEARRTRLSVRYTGEGRGVVAQRVLVTPDSALVRGANDDLARVAAVRVDLALPTGAQQFDAMVRPTPVDTRGDEVLGVQVAPNLVRVRASFITPKRGA